MDKAREHILLSQEPVRLVLGKPGAGKTYLGCAIAAHELMDQSRGLTRHQKVLFLTFARNAVARIRKVFLDRKESSQTSNRSEQEAFRERVRIDTFAGFFWWLVGAYGANATGKAGIRPWLLGSTRVGGETVPPGYEGYTFGEVQELSLELLSIVAVRRLVGDIFPVILIDEHQDVDDQLNRMIILLAEHSRLVLLRGPGQCIYSQLKQFDPNKVLQATKETLRPEVVEISPLGGRQQRLAPDLERFLETYSSARTVTWDSSATTRVLVSRNTRNGGRNEIETRAGLAVRNLFGWLQRDRQLARPVVGVVTSTNVGAAKLHARLGTGSESFHLRPMRSSLMLDDLILLHYGRLMLELLARHWICRHGHQPPDLQPVEVGLTSLARAVDRNKSSQPNDWGPVAQVLAELVSGMRPPGGRKPAGEKLQRDLDKLNDMLRTTKDKLPRGSPSTPFTKADTPLLRALRDFLLGTSIGEIRVPGVVDINVWRQSFERMMRQRLLFQKLGIVPCVQVMTIHKAKGLEFDGVVVVLEDSRTALWRKARDSSDAGVEDLYRVAISRARHGLVVVAFEDAKDVAQEPLMRLLG